ncbi:hypothetical protein [Brevundimonas sp.]|uniref:hypothetical protein n=1 Tax=Brevundimonas sp. TaxID=1871086 RepID=UPI001ACF10D2|nr:hypothetical protein [Brevundimonas sp.]MBN9465020.1 hypothetical protein [Brevundimonas sp.]
MSMIRAAAVFAVAATIVAGGPAIAFEPDCYDAEVSARITRQTPTDYANCGPDCIIMAWPWIIDLNVTRVYSGDLRRGPMTALAVQHTYFNQARNGRRWLLRRNTLGNYNIMRPTADEPLARCPANIPPARPFISPPDGKTLDDLRREGEDRYGPDPYD